MPDKMQQLATARHAGYFRKGDNPKPYITHPAAVVKRLLSWGIPEDSPLIDAAWGHDLIEDVQVPKEEIVAASSLEVWEIINQLTFDPQKCSKEEYLETVANSGSRSVLLVKAADRLCNTQEFLETFSYDDLSYLEEADSPPKSLDDSSELPELDDPSSPDKNDSNGSKDVTVPDVKYPGNDPTIAPDDYTWKGNGSQGSKQGNYYNSNNKSSLHPDLQHPEPIGPHWDYSGPEGKFRIFPDGRILPK